MPNINKQNIDLKIIFFLLSLIGLSASASPAQVESNHRVIEFQTGISETVERVAGKNQQWFSYQVAMEPNNGMPCCLINKTESTCHLDNRRNGWSSSTNYPEASKVLNLYFKMDKGQPSELFLAGSECKVEAGGNTVYTIDSVAQSASISFLKKLVEPGDLNTQMEHTILAAIALHQGNGAHAVLESFANSDRKKRQHESIFWLGQARNKSGYESLLQIVNDSSRDDKTRRQAVFALSENSDERSSEKLVELAKRSDSEKIQAEAVFWLAQNYPAKASNVIDHILKNSDNHRLRKKAIFSLTQIETEASWQRLIGLAQSDDDTILREDAIFWLSQNESKNSVPILMALVKDKNPESVKKKAVFALAQLESSQSTPALSELASTATEKSIKKEALFWLGQSDDPKALNYIERILVSSP